jgi:hypothetical protein
MSAEVAAAAAPGAIGGDVLSVAHDAIRTVDTSAANVTSADADADAIAGATGARRRERLSERFAMALFRCREFDGAV